MEERTPPGPGRSRVPGVGTGSRRGLSFARYQAQVAAWVADHGGFFPPLANLARLTEEVGELARVLGARFGPKVPKPGEATGDAAEELGDLAFVLAVLAEQLGVDLGAAATASLRKAKARDAGRFGATPPATQPGGGRAPSDPGSRKPMA